MTEKSDEIQRACRIGDLSILKKAIEACPDGINELDPKLGWSPLYRAVICGHVELVRMLLQSGADPNCRNKLGETPMHQAADAGNYKITQVLLEKRADPNLQQSGKCYSDGSTPLHRTVMKGHYKVAWLLLKHKASPNIAMEAVRDRQTGKTPLHLAVEGNNKKLVQLLLRYGASESATDKSGQRPVDLARSQDIEKQFIDGCSEVATPCDLSVESIDPVLELPQDSVQEAKDLLDVIVTVRNSARDDSEDLIFTPEQIVSPQGFKVFNFETGSQQSLSRKCSSIMEPECENTVRNSIKTPPVRSFSFGHDPKKSMLFNWLKRLRLECIFESLIEAGYDDLELLIGQMRSDIPLTLEHIREIGIEKAGHRVRLLAGLEELVGAPVLDVRKAEGGSSTFSLSFCTVAQAASGLAFLPSLMQWLDSLKLKHLHQNFVEAGYDDLEHLLALMHTRYPLTDDVLKSEINIYKLGHRHRLLFKLKQDCGKVKSMTGGVEAEGGMSLEREEKSQACEMCNLM